MEIIGENVKIKKIAVTGIVASGKSTFCDILAKNKGAYIVKSDDVVHQLYSQNKEIQQQLIDIFGEGIITDNKIDRKKLAKIVFSDETSLRKLEKLVHPLVIDMIKKKYEEIKNQSFSAFVVEHPLLFEMGAEKWYDVNVVVQSDEDECQKRFTKNSADGTFDKRMSFQFSQDKKISKADIIIDNRGPIDLLEKQVNRCLA